MKKRFAEIARATCLLSSLLLVVALAEAQESPRRYSKTVTGIVTDSKGEPIDGASVQVKGKSWGAIANDRGVYNLVIPDSINVMLIFSATNFLTKEIRLPIALTVMNAKLEESATSLEDVVVIGYGTVKKKDVTGAVAQANVADMKKAPVNTFAEALAGRVAGVNVSSSDGQPGSEMNIVIRGNNSVTQDNSPLYVIDGFPVETASANIINPEEIESIEILKDASATAIYGARGANGVVIITTKKGKVGAPVVTYDAWVGMHQNLKKQELLSPYEFVKYQIEMSPSVNGPIYLNNGKTLESYKDVKGADWQDLIFRDAFVQSHSLALRGGTDKTRYSVSGSMIDQDGIIINSGFRRYQGRLSLDQTINTKFKAGVNINYTSYKRYGTIAAESQSSPTATMMYSVWGYRPITGDSAANANMEDMLFDPGIDPATDFRMNPVLSTKNEYNPLFNNTLIVNSYIDYKINRFLSLRVTGGMTKTQIRREIFNSSSTRGGHPRNNQGVNGSITNTDLTNLLNENTLTYNRRFNKDHNLNVVAGFTVQDIKGSVNGFTATQVPTESLGIKGLGQGTVTVSPTSAPASGLLSYLGRVNYNFKSRYLLTLSFRADGSSKFPKDNRWAYFPSGAFAWRLADEKFMKQFDWLSEAKVRIGYGTTGNNRVNDFSAWSSLEINPTTGYSYGNVPGQGMVPINLGNDKLKWETTAQTNIGLDLGFFNNRITLTTDYYYKETKDLLLNATLAPSQGFLTGYKNVGKVSNEGVEFTLNTRNIENKNFSWSSSFNIAFNKNKVLALNDGESSLATRVTWGNFNNAFPYIAIPGNPIALYYGMLFDGIYQYSDFDKVGETYILKANVPNNGNARANIQPGHIKFKDINGDNKIDDNDLTIIGNPNPIHTGGFTNNFTYKNWDLNVFFQWSYGNDLLNANRIEFEGGDPVTRNLLNMFKSVENRWTPDNQNNEMYKIGGQGPAYYSSRTIEDGSYIRLKTVSLGYNIDTKTLKKLKIKSLRFYLAAQNLLTWTNYSGLDPEVNTRPSALTPGFDFSPYPRTRTLTFGLNASF
ncbi:SusC/RagA family TonB-linked outer membrane protein [Pseudobacter ginsenosidimutans]|uniref:TonB-linked SusC/RagA family outer membrane protein n=1 Tax=Pseudobacter ginsenosidimutans TaxID=661488 RepID=A0A4Q7N5B6_9BACT|nr:TonB-dependent receptor [Pseudobacter ginsenosidimutans]QEC44736.1 TonB-dependent receptor [Pseudobacter ginsenosidimutans]RZS76219.1 TonB-linked SusC/RagA family outer membrane protein [Pseudobacter ginsenosidimutans]